MAFSTVTGSNGVTSLVGTTGVDSATVVTLASDVYVAGNTGNDILTTALGTGGNNLTNYDVRMGGGNDTFTLGDSLLNSTVYLDGATAANDGDDTFAGVSNLIINSDIRAGSGVDTYTNIVASGSNVNGNAGNDTITLVDGSSNSSIWGGQGTDTITVGLVAGGGTSGSTMFINGNRGSDTITVNVGSFAAGSVYGGNGNDTINMNSTTDGVLVSGDLGIDNITTSTGDDTVNGGDGNDTIATVAGTDTIDAGAGNDTITGGADADTIAGGTGNDTFVIGTTDSLITAATPSAGFDTISDFVANTGNDAANVNGDIITFGTVTTVIADTFATGGVSLLADLAANVIWAAADEVSTVTITGSSAWAGLYLAYNNGTGGGGEVFAVDDTLVKVNTITGVEVDSFNL